LARHFFSASQGDQVQWRKEILFVWEMRSISRILILYCFLSLTLSAQTTPADDDEPIRVDTQLVTLPVAVGRAGVSVRGLKSSNFVIYEDGKRQEIADFSTTAEPFEIALLLDTSGSARNELQLIKNAAKSFVASLRPGDRVSIVAFDTERSETTPFAKSEVVIGLSSDRAELNAALDRIKMSNGTPLYDSLVAVAEKVFRDPPSADFVGRRALVALTDGVDSTSANDFAAAKEELAARGIISFFISVDTRQFFESELLGDCRSAIKFSAQQIRRYYRTFGPRAAGERAASFCQLGDFERLAVSKKLYEIAEAEMNELAKASGGRVFPVSDLSEARGAFKSVAEEIGTRYTIGYYPSNDKRDGTYRKIKVELKGVPPGAIVQTREGYTAPKS
jgi:Ca-activated chloride channel homolog